MNNLSSSLKKFVGNKNTVTILAVIVCMLILYFGFKWRVNQEVTYIDVYCAKETILPKTKIGPEDIELKQVPESYLDQLDYVTRKEDIIGLYSDINATIPKGSVIFKDLVTEEENLPDAIFKKIPEGYVLTQVKVDIETTYGNSIMPGNKIDLYFTTNDNNKAIFGKFFEDVEVLAVRDSNGKDLFYSSKTTESGETVEAGAPAYIYVALPERLFILVGKSSNISTNTIKYMIVPTGVEIEPGIDYVTIESEDIENFINERSTTVDSNIIDEEDDVTIKLKEEKEKAEAKKKEEKAKEEANKKENNQNQ